jgi:lipopolysaccharide transport protein LptA
MHAPKQPGKSARIRLLTGLMTMALLLCAGGPATAQVSMEDLRLPISLDAESTDYDGKSSMLMFRGLRLSQGNIAVEADIGRATKLDFEDSVWRFSGNVVIDTENGHIECESADLRFENHELRFATITGAPATFEMRRPESDETTYAEAGKLDYDFGAGVVEFSENATITEGGNQISSNFLVYNIVEQRINAQSTGSDGERVKITYTPKSPDADSGPDTELPSDDTGNDEPQAPDESGDDTDMDTETDDALNDSSNKTEGAPVEPGDRAS